MSDLPGVVVMGPAGRMGRMLCDAVRSSDRLRLAGAVERPGHDWVGQDIGTARGEAAWGVSVSDDLKSALATAKVVMDFTSPAATVAIAAAAAETGAVHVIGTTGMTPEDIAAVDASSDRAVIVRAGNMSLGVNLLLGLTRKVAGALGEDFDIEITEAHHHHKVDAPSGTALMLGEAAAEGRGVALEDVRDSRRDGITGARRTGAIGFHAIRGGDIVGEHEVLFAGNGERIKISHIATDRKLFASGAVKAAIWGLGQAPGHYSMADVLGL